MARLVRLKRIAKWTLAIVLAALAIFAVTPLGRYLIRAGIAEAKILAGRRPIEQVVDDPELPAENRRKLRLVIRARLFAVDSLDLRAGKSFTQYTQLDRDTLVLVLSAAPKDRLVRHTWWFPVVGRLPYKGFFDYDRARREATDMEANGFDVNLRPAAAFSTLGWFNDPILSTTLNADSIDLVDTVIHELTHNTFFASGEAVFNESFANFVGARGSAHFFRSGGDSASAEEADRRWHDQLVLGRYWARLFRELDSAFRANPDDRDRRLVIRDSTYAAARRFMVDSLAGEVLGIAASYFQRVRLDNAALLARRVYATDLELFDEVFEIEGKDLRRTIARVIRISEGTDGSPAAALKEWVTARR